MKEHIGGLKVRTHKSEDAVSDSAKLVADLVIGRSAVWSSAFNDDGVQTLDFGFAFLQSDLQLSTFFLLRQYFLVQTYSFSIRKLKLRAEIVISVFQQLNLARRRRRRRPAVLWSLSSVSNHTLLCH